MLSFTVFAFELGMSKTLCSPSALGAFSHFWSHCDLRQMATSKKVKAAMHFSNGKNQMSTSDAYELNMITIFIYHLKHFIPCLSSWFTVVSIIVKAFPVKSKIK